MKNRIEFIDLSKGICIMLVVWWHVCLLCHLNDNKLLDIIGSFRMPLYFILSGLFFKEYNGFVDFCMRKTNKLLVPFFSFYILLSILLPSLLKWCEGEYTLRYTLRCCFGWAIDHIYNGPTWFLLVLFVTNLLFYMVYSLSQRFRNKALVIVCLSILCGFIGSLLSIYGVRLPIYIDTAFTVVPFFAFGYLAKQKTNLLYPNKFDRYNWLFMLLLSLAALIPYSLGIPMRYRTNVMLINPLYVYLCGIAGTVFVLLLSKYIKSLPFISYIGRYSIIILIMHWSILMVIQTCSPEVFQPDYKYALLLLVVVLLINFLCIPLMVKYMPRITAQKDLL